MADLHHLNAVASPADAVASLDQRTWIWEREYRRSLLDDEKRRISTSRRIDITAVRDGRWPKSEE